MHELLQPLSLPAAAIHPPSLANVRWRMFAQQELDSCWVLYFIDRGAHMCCSCSALAHLHVCSTRCADCAYLSSSLACKCELEDFRPMWGVSLPHGAYFEGERDQTCCCCSTFILWDVCSTKHPNFHSVLPPSWDGPKCAATVVHPPLGDVCSTRHPNLCFGAVSIICKGEEAFHTCRESNLCM